MQGRAHQDQAHVNQTFVVTGANRGLGLELSRQLQAAGARVIATARQPSAADALQTLGVQVEALDVADEASVAAFALRLGEMAVDVLINNAGRGGAAGGIVEQDFAEMARLFAVNSIGPLRVTQALLPHLSRGSRRIVAQISSQMGSLTNNLQGGYYAYRASKTALNMLNRTLALELGAKRFICVALNPGWVRTDMGGPEAPLSPAQSARGLLRVIAKLSAKENGAFLDHRGATVPW